MTDADQITAAVAQARSRLPNLPDDYGPRAIASRQDRQSRSRATSSP